MDDAIMCMVGVDEPIVCIPASKCIEVKTYADGSQMIEIPLSMCEFKGSVSCFVFEEGC